MTVLRDLALWLRPAEWPVLPDVVRRRVRALSWFAIATQVLFIVGWIIAGALEPGYSPVRSTISELGAHGAAHPWIFDVSVVVWGLGFIALAVAMLPSLRTRRWAWVAPSLFVLAGVSAMLVAPILLDCAGTVSHACRMREAAGSLSWHAYGHIWASRGIEVSLLLTAFVLARSLWPGRLARLMFFGAVVVAAFLLFLGLLGIWIGTHNGYVGDIGLWERISALVANAWAAVCATVLIIEASPG